MTALLEAAIAKARELPEEEQDAAADALFASMAREEVQHRLTPEQADEVKRIQRGLMDGSTTLLSDEEMDAFWRACRA